MVTFGFSSEGNINTAISIGPEDYVIEGNGGINKVQVVSGLRQGVAIFGLAPSGLLLFTNLTESNAIVTKRYNTQNWTTLNLVASFIYLIGVIIWFWINVINLHSNTRKMQVLTAVFTELIVIGFSTLVYYLNYFDTETYNLNRRVSFFKRATAQLETDTVIIVNLVLHSIGSVIGVSMIIYEYNYVKGPGSFFGRFIRRVVFEYTLFNSIFLVFTEGQRNTGFCVIILTAMTVWLYYIWSYWIILFERMVGLAILVDKMADVGVANTLPLIANHSSQDVSINIIQRIRNVGSSGKVRDIAMILIVYTLYLAYIVYYTSAFTVIPISREFFEGYGNYWGFYIFIEFIPMIMAWLSASSYHDEQVTRFFGKDLSTLSDIFAEANGIVKKRR